MATIPRHLIPPDFITISYIDEHGELMEASYHPSGQWAMDKLMELNGFTPTVKVVVDGPLQ